MTVIEKEEDQQPITVRHGKLVTHGDSAYSQGASLSISFDTNPYKPPVE
jgi:hypothetical protein